MENNLEKICDNLQNQFDIEEPRIGHFDRFEAKLKGQNKKRNRFNFKYIAVAACLVLLFSLVFTTTSFEENKGVELAEISPEMKETQDYFASVIREEMKKVAKQRNAENDEIIGDALYQLEMIEENYKKLTLELKESDNSKEIIYAMINNFQQRIAVLENLLQELDNFKQLKNSNNENKTT